jgi:hypothetical protein
MGQQQVERIIPQQIKYIALGEDCIDAPIVEQLPPPRTLEERMSLIELKFEQIVKAIDSLFVSIKEVRDKMYAKKDKVIEYVIEKNKSSERIPVGTQMYGTTNGLTYWCEAKEDGFYVGTTKYPSVSAAAEGVSKVRRSGWVFWHLMNGKTLKEVFKQ